MTKEYDIKEILFCQFCADVLKTLQGEHVSEWFLIRCGLCANFKIYCEVNGRSSAFMEGAYNWLKELFNKCGLDQDYPFYSEMDADVAHGTYVREQCENSLYSNENRLAFLKKFANKVN